MKDIHLRHRYSKSKARSTYSLGKEGRKCRICFERENSTSTAIHSLHGNYSFSNHSLSFQHSSKGNQTDFHELRHSLFLRILLYLFLKVFARSRCANEKELISPCACKGSMRFVHRGCLNAWRYACENEKSFYRCEQCSCRYALEQCFLTRFLGRAMFQVSLCAFVVLVHFAIILGIFHFTRLNLFRMLQNGALGKLSASFITVAILQSTFYELSLVVSGNLLFACYRLEKFGFFIDKCIIFVIALFVWRGHFNWVYHISSLVSKELYKSYPVNKICPEVI